jgi:hypothetical protein
MLDYARQRAIQALSAPRTAVLATSGPAGVQVGKFPCKAVGLKLYLLIPQTSDHLFNLEHNPGVSILTDEWALKGAGKIIAAAAGDACSKPFETSGSYAAWLKWCALICIDPHQLQIHQEMGWGNRETIDLQLHSRET